MVPRHRVEVVLPPRILIRRPRTRTPSEYNNGPVANEVEVGEGAQEVPIFEVGGVGAQEVPGIEVEAAEGQAEEVPAVEVPGNEVPGEAQGERARDEGEEMVQREVTRLLRRRAQDLRVQIGYLQTELAGLEMGLRGRE
jgi:hypothetical protein